MFIKELVYGAYVRDYVWVYSKAGEKIKEHTGSPILVKTNISNICLGKTHHTFIREKYIESILDSKKYKFKKPLLIKQPYAISGQVCLLVFNTDEKYSVRYTVMGKFDSPDFVGEDNIFSDRHRVAIMGLYEKCVNKIIVELLDEEKNVVAKKNLKVYMPNIPDDYKDDGRVIIEGDERTSEFFFVSGGYSAGVRVIDRWGNMRGSMLSLPHAYGVYGLRNNEFLFSEHGMRRPMYGNAHSVVTVHTDIMGRSFRTFLDEKGFHHWAGAADGRFIGLSSSLYDGYMENTVRLIDYNTGKLIKEINLADYFDDKFKNRADWIHVNAIEYQKEDDSFILCMRNIHSVAKVDLKTEEMKWILCNPEFYEGTKEYAKVLQPEKDQDPKKVQWFYQQHGAQIIYNLKGADPDRLYIGIFDNHVINRRKVKWFDGDLHSYVVVFSIDEKNMTFRYEKRFQVPLTNTRANFNYDEKTNTIYAFAAVMAEDEDGCRSKIVQFDYETGEKIFEMNVRKDFFTAHTFSFDVHEMSKHHLVDDKKMIVGSLYESVVVKGIQKNNLIRKCEMAPMISSKFFDEKTSEGSERDNHYIRTYGDTVQIFCRDHEIQKMYLYNDKNMYMQDFEDSTQKMNAFLNQHYYVSMSFANMKSGTYKLVIKTEDNLYKTEYKITLKNKKK
ncbi:MAG: aryl-sulfate sulfotransferase [Lachnospiraceae bacterium]|nr:aryl-sulfate sulfotransferase [Lachnospiraceae bacterium]